MVHCSNYNNYYTLTNRYLSVIQYILTFVEGMDDTFGLESCLLELCVRLGLGRQDSTFRLKVTGRKRGRWRGGKLIKKRKVYILPTYTSVQTLPTIDDANDSPQPQNDQKRSSFKSRLLFPAPKDNSISCVAYNRCTLLVEGNVVHIIMRM